MNMKQYFDSLIFDMDGTLWDAVPSYCKIWEYTLDEFGLGDIKVTREELDRLMGKPVDVLVDTIVTRHVDRTRFLAALDANEDRLMPVLGGRLYPGVKETIRELARDHKLFMVSNCSPKGAVNFMAYSGLTDCFTDSLTYGQTHVGKDVNIATLVNRYRPRVSALCGRHAGRCRRLSQGRRSDSLGRVWLRSCQRPRLYHKKIQRSDKISEKWRVLIKINFVF